MNVPNAIICSTPEQVYTMNNMNNGGIKFILLDDDVTLNGISFVQASILLPPPNILFTLVDTNDVSTFTQEYYQYLSSSLEVDQFIVLLGTVLLKGYTLAICTGNGDPEMYMGQLMDYLTRYYGINLIPFEYANNPNEVISSIMKPALLYKAVSYNYISIDEYNAFLGIQPQPQVPQDNNIVINNAFERFGGM